jgi:hypothetical protein
MPIGRFDRDNRVGRLAEPPSRIRMRAQPAVSRESPGYNSISIAGASSVSGTTFFSFITDVFIRVTYVASRQLGSHKEPGRFEIKSYDLLPTGRFAPAIFNNSLSLVRFARRVRGAARPSPAPDGGRDDATHRSTSRCSGWEVSLSASRRAENLRSGHCVLS